MSRQKRYHDKELPAKIALYAKEHELDFNQYTEYHLRLMDGGFTVLDLWTTGRYYIVTTDYLEMLGEGYIERAGEKGNLPSNDMYKLAMWLDKVFFHPEVA